MATPDEIIAIYKSKEKHADFIAELVREQGGAYADNSGVSPAIYFKITNRKETHHGFQYQDGLNVDDQPFNPSGCCSGGGLYFTTLENLHMFEHFGVNIRPIVVPSGVPIYDEVCTSITHWNCHKFHYKSKAPKVYLLPKIKLGSTESFKLLYNFKLGNANKNNQFAQSRMYLSDDPNAMSLYGGYYAHKYISLLGNSYGTNYSLDKPIDPIPYAKKRKFHPEHKQLVHCKVKDLILQNKMDELFALINEKKTLLYWLYYKPKNIFYENRSVSISELFYIFLKHQDKAFLHFMKDEYFPRQLRLRTPQLRLRSPGESEQEQKEITMDYAVHSITEDMASIIDRNIYKLILKYQGIISGSYALKHRIGAKWTCDDIDVYLPACDFVDVHYKYFEFVNEVLNSRGNTSKPCPCETGSESRRGNAATYNMTNIDEIINITQKNGIKLQFIFVKVDPFEFIKDNFDFDFCKVCFRPDENRFDGGSAARAGAGRIDQAYMDKISKWNMDDSYSVYRAAKTMDRITKYMARGFTITNLDEFFDCLEKLFD
jgi:hypothetical protein